MKKTEENCGLRMSMFTFYNALHYMVWLNSRQDQDLLMKLWPDVTCLSLAQPEQRKHAMTKSGRRAIREVVRPPNHQSCCSIGVLKEFHKTIGHQGGKHNCQK